MGGVEAIEKPRKYFVALIYKKTTPPDALYATISCLGMVLVYLVLAILYSTGVFLQPCMEK